MRRSHMHGSDNNRNCGGSAPKVWKPSFLLGAGSACVIVSIEGGDRWSVNKFRLILWKPEQRIAPRAQWAHIGAEYPPKADSFLGGVTALARMRVGVNFVTYGVGVTESAKP
jgi:hypothetical protein